MARARNIKPGFFTNDVLADCDPLARLLFAGLWTVADRGHDSEIVAAIRRVMGDRDPSKGFSLE